MGWPKGKPRSNETKDKIRAWSLEHREQLSRNISDEQKWRISVAMSLTLQGNKRRLGIPHTEETKKRISEASRAQWASRADRHQTVEHIKHNADARRGYLHSEETKLHMRESKIGISLSESHRESIRQSHIGDKNYMFGKNHSEEAKRKIGDAERGDKNPRWNGGVSFLPYPFQFNKELKERIRKRDNYTCQLCRIPQSELVRKLDVHHIDYDKENLANSNLISLCRKCNSKVNKNRAYWQSYFSPVTTEG